MLRGAIHEDSGMAWFFDKSTRRLFHDHMWKRDEMAAWDQRWAVLSSEARQAFLALHIPYWPGEAMPAITAADVPVKPREELLKAGFIEPVAGGKIRPLPAVWGFATRVHMLRRWQLLDPSANALTQYVQQTFLTYELSTVLDKVVEKQVGRISACYLDDCLRDFVSHRFWPDWVADYLGKPLFQRIIEAIGQADGRVALDKLPSLLPDEPADAVRATADALVNHLALFEDVQPTTLELLIGFLPSVLADRQRVAHPKPLPQLTPQSTPTKIGPVEGVRILDMRALLLELTGNRARMKQNGELYAKELERLLAVMTELPGWMADDWTDPSGRLNDTLRWMRQHHLLVSAEEGERDRFLEPGSTGKKWLAASLGEQYEQLFGWYSKPRRDGYEVYFGTDREFLNSEIVSVLLPPQDSKKGKRPTPSGNLDPEARQAFREAVYLALNLLPAGEFVGADDFIEVVAAVRSTR